MQIWGVKTALIFTVGYSQLVDRGVHGDLSKIFRTVGKII